MNISGGNQLLDPQAIFSHLTILPGMRIADLGCGGAGHFVLPAAQAIGPAGLVYAVDLRRSALNAVTSSATLLGLKNVKPVWANLEVLGSTKIPDNSIDIAFLINILFQAAHHPYIIQEAVRILKPGGQLLMVDWTEAEGPLGPPLTSRVQPGAIKELAAEQELKLKSEFGAGQWHYGMVFVK